ncbi:formate dehydrogenase accessory sulfurtransferase FdhD [Terrihabitans sp. B22-R8]|uniref:formate dehydrogenase accessory sulfurtransferase FdhD n=1 Tax=Terrihabitans sp. B22-R8 TaxID=3425128 RepID=UPI00403C99E5
MPDPAEHVESLAWRNEALSTIERAIPSEVPIAITYGGSTQAVMMATPGDLEDFAVGFGITEGLISGIDDIASLEVVEEDQGIELRMWLAPELADTYSRRRRLLAGPTGCGLCGIESLEEAVKPTRRVPHQTSFTTTQIVEAAQSLSPAQILNQQTRAMHAAGFWSPEQGLLAVREDVGRHNALDKLVGCMIREKREAAHGIVVLTSRVSVEMVQKTAVLGASAIVAVSAPTSLALRTADAAGITLIAIARGSEFEVFTGKQHITAG